MDFRILHAYGEEGDRWLLLVDELTSEQRDIHFLPQYGEVYNRTYGQEPFLAFYGDEDCFIIQPFVKRPLNDLPFLIDQNITQPYYDIANPYGYGGPVCKCVDPELTKRMITEFEACFSDYCQQEGFASEFTSLHPLLGNQELVKESKSVKAQHQKQIVYFDLELTEDELWQGINRGHKSGINKARKSGVSVVKVEPTPQNLALFNELYYQTMERNRAAERWLFPRDYFRNCCEILGEDRTSLFLAYVEGELASAYLLVHDFKTAYYHFGASDSRFYDLRPNNLLMYETACWAKEVGYSKYHLGGGVTSSPDDGLFRFKSGFSPKTAVLYTYYRVLHRQTYEELCRLKEQYEVTMNSSVDSDYFPMYRR